jgi:hypothetical protein
MPSVIRKICCNPKSACVAGIDEEHRAQGSVGVIGVHDVRPHGHAVPHPPVAVPAADPHRAFYCDDDLNGVMRMRRDDAFTAADCKKSAVPQVPTWRAGPARLAAVAGGSRFIQGHQQARSILSQVLLATFEEAAAMVAAKLLGSDAMTSSRCTESSPIRREATFVLVERRTQ